MRVSASDFYIEGTFFQFYCRPYFLKLHLTGEVLDDERTRAVYDVEENNGTIHVHLPKKTKGETFPDLQMLTKLLSVKASVADVASLSDKLTGCSIEVISSSNSEENQANGNGEDYDGEKESVPAGDLLSSGKSVSNFLGCITYGFNNRYSNFFVGHRGQCDEIVALPQPDQVKQDDRRAMRTHSEEEDFDLDRYAADFAYGEEDTLYQAAMACIPFWSSFAREKEGDGNFDEQEREQLVHLPRREYLIDEKGTDGFSLLCGLSSILYAYAYDFRLTDGDPTVESNWTVATVSPLLSWLDEIGDIKHALTACLRRSLIYPYLRSWKLSSLVLTDVLQIFSNGKHGILRALLRVKKIFETCETRYLLNKLFIDDYCVWIQGVEEATLDTFWKKLSEVLSSITKGDVDLELEHIEAQVTAQLRGGDNDDSSSATNSDN